MTDLKPSNLDFLRMEFRDIIQNERETDHHGKSSTLSSQRRTFVFTDRTFLSITEILLGGKIERYYYEWFNSKKEVIIKFHSEPHEDKQHQTLTEPFHMHTVDALDEGKRLPNQYFQDLNQILNFIRTSMAIHRFIE